jgi:hypothetical protein
MKSRILYLATEFTIVFLAVLLAFFTNSWAEEKRDEKEMAVVLSNLVADVKRDSANILDAITALRDQNDSIMLLIKDLGMFNHKKANGNVVCTYYSFSSFEPTTAMIESMIFGVKMKLVGNHTKFKAIKDLDHMNAKLRTLRNEYVATVESFRNTFICQHNMQHFDFSALPQSQGTELWNRLKFLSASVEQYYVALLMAQGKYNAFLKDFGDSKGK